MFRGVECEPPHFLVRATFCTISRPSHLKMLVLQFFFFNCAFFCRFKTFFKNPATLGHKIWKDLHMFRTQFAKSTIKENILNVEFWWTLNLLVCSWNTAVLQYMFVYSRESLQGCTHLRNRHNSRNTEIVTGLYPDYIKLIMLRLMIERYGAEYLGKYY